MRTPAVARFSAISSARLVMRLTLMPAWGCSSYRVTEGPRQMSRICVLDAETFQAFVDQRVGVFLHFPRRPGFIFGPGGVKQVQRRVAVGLGRLGFPVLAARAAALAAEGGV